jgi:hypothetical protein
VTIDPLSASKFIAVYKALLLEIDHTGHDRRKSNLIKRLAAARLRLSSDPAEESGSGELGFPA